MSGDGVQTVTEFDNSKAKALYSELNSIMIDETAVAIYAPQAVRIAMTKNVRGVKHHAMAGFEFRNTWLAS